MREKAKEYLKLKAHCSRICGYFTIAKNYAGEYVITFNGSEQGNEKRLFTQLSVFTSSIKIFLQIPAYIILTTIIQKILWMR